MEPSRTNSKKATSKLVLFLAAASCLLLASILVMANVATDLNGYGNEIKTMKDSGMNVWRIEELLVQAKNAFSNNETDRTSRLLIEIKALKEKTLEIDSKLKKEKDVITFLKDANISTGIIQEEYSKAISEFALGNLVGTEEHLNKVISENRIILGRRYNYLLGELNESVFTGLGIKKDVMKQKEDMLKTSINERDFTKIKLLEKEIILTKKILSELDQAKKKMDEMSSRNIPRFSDMFNEAKLRIEINQLDEAEKISGSLNELFEKEKKVSEKIAVLEGKISEYKLDGIDASVAEANLESIKKEYDVNNYEKAEKVLDENILLLETLKEEHLISGSLETKSRMSFGDFIKMNWWIIAVLLVAMASAYLLLHKRVEKSYYSRIVEKYKREKQAITEIMKKMQDDYFNKKIISKGEYEQKMDELQEKLAYIDGKMPIFESKMMKNG
jgi:hypothetical protein